jgi:transposase-like protein
VIAVLQRWMEKRRNPRREAAVARDELLQVRQAARRADQQVNCLIEQLRENVRDAERTMLEASGAGSTTTLGEGIREG